MAPSVDEKYNTIEDAFSNKKIFQRQKAKNVYSHGMLGVSGPERAKTDSESGETEDDEDASIKLSIPAITIVL